MNVFDGFVIGSMHLNNRIIRSATHEGMTDENGDPNDKLISLYSELAKGGAGAIITGYAAVTKNGKAPTPNMLMFDDDPHILAYQKLTSAVKEFETSLILQIAHCGRQTRRAVTGYPTVAPSAIKDWLYNEEVPHELTTDEIAEVVEAFVNAAERAKKSGFDGVQIHAAHGYLLSSFLSPHMNIRTDEFGGNTENRFRIVRSIAEGIRERVGNFPMLIKINCFEKSKNGIKTEEAVKIAKLCVSAGFDAIETSCGIMEEGMVMCRGELPIDIMMRTNFRLKNIPKIMKPIVKPYINMKMKSPEPLALYNVDAAAEIKRNVNIPVIVVGGIKEFSDVQKIIENKCDAVSMSRPFIIEPDIVNRFKNGQERSSCIECNKCLMRAEGYELRCYCVSSSQ